MTEGKKKRALKPLLVAGTGIALLSIGASGCFTSGNLMPPPPCPEGQGRDSNYECRPLLPDGGVDEGNDDAGTP